MEVVLEDMGSRLRIYPAVLLSESENFAVAGVVRGEGSVPHRVVEALVSYLRGDESGIEGLERRDRVLLYAIAYGGITLHYIGDGDPIPLARIVTLHYSLRTRGAREACVPPSLDDKGVLNAWSLLYRGREREGLSMLGACSVYPEHLALEVVGEPSLPLGYESKPL